jgi:RHS repeat-associated protein
MTMDSFTVESRQYNARGQLTRIQIPSTLDVEYGYSSAQNDGRITSMKNNLSGEEVAYQYDQLGRLARAETVGPQWGQSFSYDGWGNLTGMSVVKGSAPTMSTTADPATNRLNAWNYDANGNATNIPGVGNLAYDAANRVTAAGYESYGYDAAGLRLWRTASGTTTYTFTGWDGSRMGYYTLGDFLLSEPYADRQVLAFSATPTQPPLQFAGRKLQLEDRLGSATGPNYYPYGQTKAGGAATGESFATYHRDGTGLDYAQNRYYAPGWGRFVTADPYEASAGAYRPASWNRASYVINDPLSFIDPNGLEFCVSPAEAQMMRDASVPVCPANGGGSGSGVCFLDGISVPCSMAMRVYGMGAALPTSASSTATLWLCAVQPELCVIGVGVTISVWVVHAHWSDFVHFARRVARHYARLQWSQHNTGRDGDGNCRPVDPSKFEKYLGTTPDHWHWVEWNVDPETCEARPTFKSGPDPGPDWQQVPRP